MARFKFKGNQKVTYNGTTPTAPPPTGTPTPPGYQPPPTGTPPAGNVKGKGNTRGKAPPVYYGPPKPPVSPADQWWANQYANYPVYGSDEQQRLYVANQASQYPQLGGQTYLPYGPYPEGGAPAVEEQQPQRPGTDRYGQPYRPLNTYLLATQNNTIMTRNGELWYRAGVNDVLRSKLKEYGFKWNGWWVGRDSQGARRVLGKEYYGKPGGGGGGGGGGWGGDRDAAGVWYSRLVNWRVD